MLEELVNFQVFGTKGGIFATHLVALVGFLSVNREAMLPGGPFVLGQVLKVELVNLHVLCQFAIVGGVVVALGAVEPVEVAVRSHVHLHGILSDALKVVLRACVTFMTPQVLLQIPLVS